MSNTTSFGYPIPAVRKVSALRQRMIDDMTVRNFAPNTQVSYLHQVNLRIHSRYPGLRTGFTFNSSSTSAARQRDRRRGRPHRHRSPP